MIEEIRTVVLRKLSDPWLLLTLLWVLLFAKEIETISPFVRSAGISQRSDRSVSASLPTYPSTSF